MEGDQRANCSGDVHILFQSTPSAWRETTIVVTRQEDISISIHSLRMEGDFKRIFFSSLLFIFQSTPSAWRETGISFILFTILSFQSTPSAWRETSYCHFFTHSIRHFNPLPPHGGRQGRLFHDRGENDHFNPLPPHGGRLIIFVVTFSIREFQSTPSAWRETDRPLYQETYDPFQSTPSAWRET